MMSSIFQRHNDPDMMLGWEKFPITSLSFWMGSIAGLSAVRVFIVYLENPVKA